MTWKYIDFDSEKIGRRKACLRVGNGRQQVRRQFTVPVPSIERHTIKGREGYFYRFIWKQVRTRVWTRWEDWK